MVIKTVSIKKVIGLSFPQEAFQRNALKFHPKGSFAKASSPGRKPLPKY